MRVTIAIVVAVWMFATSSTAQTMRTTGQGNLLNPEITVFVDLAGSVSSNEDNKAHNRFTLREAEFDFRADVAPIAYAVVNAAVHEEIEDQFSDDVDVSMEFGLEEGYLDVHTLPYGLATKAGKFRATFGRNNLLHTHDLPQSSRPLPVQAFLGHEGLVTVGGELAWLVPNPWDQYLESRTAVVNADAGEESPLFRGPSAANPAVVSHLKWFGDLTQSLSLEVGSSLLYVRPNDGFDENLAGGADITWTWRDANSPDTRSAILQAEFFISRADSVSEGPAHQRRTHIGGYAFGQLQFHRNAYVGVRYDYTELPGLEESRKNDQDWAASGILTWYYNEALRFRFEFQHLDREIDGKRDSEQIPTLGATFYIGAHPAHPYWVNR